MAIVVFDYAEWIVLYPDFATTVNSSQGQQCFYQACLYCDNSACAIIPYDLTQTPPIYTRAIILNMLTAHMAALQFGSVSAGQIVPAAQLVGRVSGVSEGSVSVSAEYLGPDSAAFYNQTKWGAMAYTAMAPWRTGTYRASPGRFAQIPGNWPGYGYGRGIGWPN